MIRGQQDGFRRRAFGAGRYSKKTGCAVGIQLSWELLDIYLGQFASSMIPHRSPTRSSIMNDFCRSRDEAPENTRYLAGVLDSGMREGGFLLEHIIRRVADIRKDLKASEELTPMWQQLESIPGLLNGDVTMRYEARKIVLGYLIRWTTNDLVLQCAREARLWTYQRHIESLALFSSGL